MKSARLGRGLSALIGEVQSVSATPSSDAGRIPIDLLDSGPFQPRTTMDMESLEELAESIRAQGLLQPILARPHPSMPGRFEIIAGERRWRAAGLAGLHEVPAVVRTMTDSEAAVAALVENLQRENLNPIEEAEGLQRLTTDFGLTHEAIGYAVGKSRSHIGNMLRLLKLPDQVRENIRTGKLTFGHARALLRHPDPDAAMNDIIERHMSVRETEAAVVGDTAPKARVKGAEKDPSTTELEEEIAADTGYRVRIAVGGKGRGTLTVWFNNLNQLDTITKRLRKG